MEKQLFDWLDWDCVDEAVYSFENCTLKVPIGDFKINDAIPVICVNFQDGLLTLQGVDGTELSKHKLKLTIK